MPRRRLFARASEAAPSRRRPLQIPGRARVAGPRHNFARQSCVSASPCAHVDAECCNHGKARDRRAVDRAAAALFLVVATLGTLAGGLHDGTAGLGRGAAPGWSSRRRSRRRSRARGRPLLRPMFAAFAAPAAARPAPWRRRGPAARVGCGANRLRKPAGAGWAAGRLPLARAAVFHLIHSGVRPSRRIAFKAPFSGGRRRAARALRCAGRGARPGRKTVPMTLIDSMLKRVAADAVVVPARTAAKPKAAKKQSGASTTGTSSSTNGRDFVARSGWRCWASRGSFLSRSRFLAAAGQGAGLSHAGGARRQFGARRRPPAADRSRDRANEVAAGPRGLWFSRDGGQSWTVARFAKGDHPMILAVEPDPVAGLGPAVARHRRRRLAVAGTREKPPRRRRWRGTMSRRWRPGARPARCWRWSTNRKSCGFRGTIRRRSPNSR